MRDALTFVVMFTLFCFMHPFALPVAVVFIAGYYGSELWYDFWPPRSKP